MWPWWARRATLQPTVTTNLILDVRQSVVKSNLRVYRTHASGLYPFFGLNQQLNFRSGVHPAGWSLRFLDLALRRTYLGFVEEVWFKGIWLAAKGCFRRSLFSLLWQLLLSFGWDFTYIESEAWTRSMRLWLLWRWFCPCREAVLSRCWGGLAKPESLHCRTWIWRCMIPWEGRTNRCVRVWCCSWPRLLRKHWDSRDHPYLRAHSNRPGSFPSSTWRRLTIKFMI